MSTASEMDRIPASWTRRESQRGLGRDGSMPVTVRATNVGQAGRGQLHRVAVGDLQGHRPVDRIRVRDAHSLGGLPGQAADGQAIAAVRGHRDVQHLVPQPQDTGGFAPGN